MKADILASLIAILWLTGGFFNDQVKDGSSTYSRRAYLAGRAAAERDTKRGILAVESVGLKPEWSGEYVRLLKRRYNIEDRCVAGCVVDDKIIGHLRGYNEVSNAEITRRFGSDIFDRTDNEARALYKKEYP